MDFMLVNLTEMKFQTRLRFSCEQNLVVEFNVQVRLKLIADVVSLPSFWQKRNFISGDKAFYHVNSTQIEMPARVQKNGESF